MTRNRILAGFLLALLLLPVSCVSTRVSVNKNFDFSTIKKIAVLKFDDYPMARESGREAADLFTGSMIRLGLNVLERIDVDKLFTEQKFSLSGSVAPSQIQKIGKMLSADALLLGYVSMYKNESRSTEILRTMTRNERGETYAIEQPYHYIVPAEVSITCRLVSVETGEVIFAASGSYDGANPSVAAASLIESMTEDITRQLKKKK